MTKPNHQKLISNIYWIRLSWSCTHDSFACPNCNPN